MAILITAHIFKHLAALHFKKSAVTCWHSSPQYDLVSPKSTQACESYCGHSLKVTKKVRLFSDACLPVSQCGLCTSPILNRCPLRSVLSLFIAGFRSSSSNSHAPLADSSCFLFFQPLITPLATFTDMPWSGWGPESGCEEPCLTDQLL
jgi:hypothetical protein